MKASGDSNSSAYKSSLSNVYYEVNLYNSIDE